MNEKELDALLYDCRHIGRLAEEIERRMRDLKALCSTKAIDGVRRKYPNVEDPERFNFKYNVAERMKDLQSCFEELKNDLACIGKEIPLYDARNMVAEWWEGDLFKPKNA